MNSDPDPLIEYKRNPFEEHSSDEAVPTISQFLDDQYRRHHRNSKTLKLIIGPTLIAFIFWVFFMSRGFDQNCQIPGCLEYSEFKSNDKNYILSYVEIEYEKYLSAVDLKNVTRELSELYNNKPSSCNGTVWNIEKCVKFEKSLDAAISIRDEIVTLNSKQGLTLNSLHTLIEDFHQIIDLDESKIDIDLLSKKSEELETEVQRLVNEQHERETEYLAKEAEKDSKVDVLLQPFGGTEFMIRQNEYSIIGLNEYNEDATLKCERSYSEGQDGLKSLQAKYDQISEKLLNKKSQLDKINLEIITITRELQNSEKEEIENQYQSIIEPNVRRIAQLENEIDERLKDSIYPKSLIKTQKDGLELNKKELFKLVKFNFEALKDKVQRLKKVNRDLEISKRMLLHAQEDKEALQSQTNALSEELAECKSRMESLESRIKSCIAEKAPTKEHNKLYYDELKKAKGEIDVIVKEFTDYKLKYEETLLELKTKFDSSFNTLKGIKRALRIEKQRRQSIKDKLQNYNMIVKANDWLPIKVSELRNAVSKAHQIFEEINQQSAKS